MIHFFPSRGFVLSILCMTESLFCLPTSPQDPLSPPSVVTESVEQRVQREQQQLLASPLGNIWKSWGFTPKNGVMISLTGIHSESSCGIGEYTDLLPFLSWCQDIGFDIVQFLPLNDSYQSPFSLISSCALAPRYLGLRALPHVEEYPELVAMMDVLSKRNGDLRVDIAWITDKKNGFLQMYYDRVGHEIRNTQEYQIFVEQHKDWLLDYCLYKSIDSHHQELIALNDWDPKYKNLEQNRDTLFKEFSDSIEYFQVIQYLCFDQMTQVKKKADEVGVFLMNDITFSVAKNSADVFAYPHFFLPNFNLGAMPDFFSSYGQNWNLPVFNWEHLAQDNYSWWIRRLQVMERFFSLYRLDHALGFYRQWAIREGNLPKQGMLIPEETAQQVTQGHQHLLHIIKSTNALPVAEIFGGGDVMPILHDIENLGIPSIRVSWWEKTPDNEYLPTNQIPVATALTISLHDSEIFADFWEKDFGFAKSYSHFKNWRPLQDLPSRGLYLVLRDIAMSTANIRIIPLQEYLWMFPDTAHLYPYEERINIPATVSPWNWGYRYVPSVEDLDKNSHLKEIIQSQLSGERFPKMD